MSASLRRHAEPRSSDRAYQGYALVIESKAINDAFGHAAGDDALRAFAEVLRSHTRAQDTVCRTGGEEFTVVFPDTTHDEAGRIATRSWRRCERRTSGPAPT